MASQQHPNGEEVNSIDQLNANLTSAGEKIANNKKWIFWGLGAILVVGAFVLSYIFLYRNPRLNKSFEALDKVEMTTMGNDSIAAAEYMKVADQYGSSDAGKLAALNAGELLYSLGRYADAAKYLEKFSTKEPVLGANATILLGDCYVNLKKYDQAVNTFQKAVRESEGNPQIAPRALLKQANVYDEQKKYDAALACYETIKKDYPEFQLGNGVDIDGYIEREKARLGK